MRTLTEVDLEQMRRAYRPDIARYLADRASKSLVTVYDDLVSEFGGVAQGYGDKLGGITLFCHERQLPMLPVCVVSKVSGLPSTDAVLYRDLGIQTAEGFAREQARCRAFDWSKVEF